MFGNMYMYMYVHCTCICTLYMYTYGCFVYPYTITLCPLYFCAIITVMEFVKVVSFLTCTTPVISVLCVATCM